MIERESRPMTAEERRLLEPTRRPAGPGFLTGFILLVGGPTAGLLLSAFPGMLFERLEMRSLIKPTMAAFTAAGFLGGTWVLFRGRARRRKAAAGLRDQTTCEVLRCTVHGAVEVAEFEDEGAGFFLDIGDGKLMFLQGQYLYEPVEKGEFPSHEFDLVCVRSPTGRLVLKIECRGERLTPLRKRGPVTTEEYEAGLEDGLVFPGKLGTDAIFPSRITN